MRVPLHERIHILNKTKLHAAATDVLNKTKTLTKAAVFYQLEVESIYDKTGIMNYVESHPTIKLKFETAIKDILYKRETITKAAEKHGINLMYLQMQIEYEHLSQVLSYFTFEDDLALIKRLKIGLHCTCQNCFKERLPYVAYEIAKERNIKHSIAWEKNKRAGFLWSKRFEERYASKISKLSSVCQKELLQPSTSQDCRTRTLSFDGENILNVDDRAQKQRKIERLSFDGENILDVDDRAQKQRKIERLSFDGENILDVDDRVRKQRKIERLSFDGENILDVDDRDWKQTKIDTSQTCDTDDEMFIQFMDEAATKEAILKSLEDAEREILQETLQPKNEDEFASSIREIFKTDEERLLLKCLKGVEPSYLTCRICLIKLLPALIYKFATKIGISCPSDWIRNDKVRSTWCRYFINKYENEIANFTLSENRKSQRLINRSLSLDDIISLSKDFQ